MASQSQMITAVQWVRRGAAKEVPDRYKEELDDGEEGDTNGKMNEDDSDGDEDDAPMNPNNPEDRFDMEHYDDEKATPFLGGSLTSLMMYKNQKDDPFLIMPNAETAQDMDDFMIRKSDMVLLTAVSEDEVSHLDVYVYEHEKDNLYVHHDYLLPAFPLSLAWLDFPVGGQQLSGNRTETNMVAVGTFEPYIEIWDLDTVDQPAPLALLGGPENPDDLVDGSVKGAKLIPDSHTDAVLGLSWNTLQKNLLASCSADKSIKMWDLMTGACVRTYNIHTDKVQTVMWNPVEAPIIASGGFDGKACLLDMRAPQDSAAASLACDLKSDIECLTWLPSPHHNHLLVSTENGFVYCFDILKDFSTPLWTLQAHNKATQAIAVNPFIPGLLATGSSDHSGPLKLWDISEGKPKILYSKTGDLQSVFSIKWSMDEPFVFALGTPETKPVVLDCRQYPAIQTQYGNLQFPTTNSATAARTTPPLEFTYTPPPPTTATTTTTTTTTTDSTKTTTSTSTDNSQKKKKKNKKKKST